MLLTRRRFTTLQYLRPHSHDVRHHPHTMSLLATLFRNRFYMTSHREFLSHVVSSKIGIFLLFSTMQCGVCFPTLACYALKTICTTFVDDSILRFTFYRHIHISQKIQVPFTYLRCSKFSTHTFRI